MTRQEEVKKMTHELVTSANSQCTPRRTGTRSAHWCCFLCPLWLCRHRRPGCPVRPGRPEHCCLPSAPSAPWHLSLAGACCWPHPACRQVLLEQEACCCFVLARCLSSLLQLLLCSVASRPAGIHHFSERRVSDEKTLKTKTISCRCRSYTDNSLFFFFDLRMHLCVWGWLSLPYIHN